MTDDIVTRLRDWSASLYPAKHGACMEQAADEIEWLRKQYQRASERAAYWAKMYDELTEIRNTELDDDDEIDPDDE
jgi:hypothetical protein